MPDLWRRPLLEPVRASIAEAACLGFVVSSIERGPVKAVEAGPEVEFETTADRITVLLSRPDGEDLLATWVLVEGEWVYASGVVLP